MKIEVTQEQYEFLKELQHELLTQPTDGQASPKFWGIMEEREVGVPDGCGDGRIYMGDGVVITVDKKSELSTYTGAFLTKRACKEYIDKYGYNHANPHTFAMTAIRNPEYETLINILETMKFDD